MYLPMGDTAANGDSYLIKDMTLFVLIFYVYRPLKHFTNKKKQCNHRAAEFRSTIRAIVHGFLMYKLQMFLVKLCNLYWKLSTTPTFFYLVTPKTEPSTFQIIEPTLQS